MKQIIPWIGLFCLSCLIAYFQTDRIFWLICVLVGGLAFCRILDFVAPRASRAVAHFLTGWK